MLIGIESKKECDKIVKEVLIRIKTNNLYMKLEKYKCKSEKSKIFRSCNKTRWNKDRESKKVMLDLLQT